MNFANVIAPITPFSTISTVTRVRICRVRRDALTLVECARGFKKRYGSAPHKKTARTPKTKAAK